MALLRDIQDDRNPDTDSRIEVPNIRSSFLQGSASESGRVDELPPTPAPPTPVPESTPLDKNPLGAAIQTLGADVAPVAPPSESPEGFIENVGPHDPNRVNELVKMGMGTPYRQYRDQIIQQRQWQNQRAVTQFSPELYRPDLHGSITIPTNNSRDTFGEEEGLTSEMFSELSGLIQSSNGGISQPDDFQPFTGNQRQERLNPLANVTENQALQNRTLNVDTSRRGTEDRTWAETIFGSWARLGGAGDDAEEYRDPTTVGEREELLWRAEEVIPQALALPAVLGGGLNRGLAHLLVNAPLIGDALVPPEQKDQYLDDVFHNTTRNLAAVFSLGTATERLDYHENTALNQLLDDLSPEPGQANFAPLQGNFGEAGRGIGGATIYALQTPDDLIRAFGQDMYELAFIREGTALARPQHVQDRNERLGVEEERPFALDHMMQALTGTEHSFMAPVREDGRGMGWTPIVQGQQGINLPGGGDEANFLTWLPGSGTATGFLLDLISEAGVGAVLDFAADSMQSGVKGSRASASAINGSLLPDPDGAVRPLRGPDGNVLSPEAVTEPVRVETLIQPLTPAERSRFRSATQGYAIPGLDVEGFTNSRVRAEALNQNMIAADLEILGQQRRMTQAEVAALNQQVQLSQVEVRNTYDNQRQPLSIGTHEGTTRARRVEEAAQNNPLYNGELVSDDELLRRSEEIPSSSGLQDEVVDEVEGTILPDPWDTPESVVDNTPTGAAPLGTEWDDAVESVEAEVPAKAPTVEPEPFRPIEPTADIRITDSAVRESFDIAVEPYDQVAKGVWAFFEGSRVEAELYTPNLTPDSPALEMVFSIDGRTLAAKRADKDVPTRELTKLFRELRTFSDQYGDRIPLVSSVEAADTLEAFQAKAKLYNRNGFQPVPLDEHNMYLRGEKSLRELTQLDMEEVLAKPPTEDLYMVFVPGAAEQRKARKKRAVAPPPERTAVPEQSAAPTEVVSAPIPSATQTAEPAKIESAVKAPEARSELAEGIKNFIEDNHGDDPDFHHIYTINDYREAVKAYDKVVTDSFGEDSYTLVENFIETIRDLDTKVAPPKKEVTSAPLKSKGEAVVSESVEVPTIKDPAELLGMTPEQYSAALSESDIRAEMFGLVDWITHSQVTDGLVTSPLMEGEYIEAAVVAYRNTAARYAREYGTSTKTLSNTDVALDRVLGDTPLDEYVTALKRDGAVDSLIDDVSNALAGAEDGYVGAVLGRDRLLNAEVEDLLALQNSLITRKVRSVDDVTEAVGVKPKQSDISGYKPTTTRTGDLKDSIVEQVEKVHGDDLDFYHVYDATSVDEAVDLYRTTLSDDFGSDTDAMVEEFRQSIGGAEPSPPTSNTTTKSTPPTVSTSPKRESIQDAATPDADDTTLGKGVQEYIEKNFGQDPDYYHIYKAKTPKEAIKLFSEAMAEYFPDSAAEEVRKFKRAMGADAKARKAKAKTKSSEVTPEGKVQVDYETKTDRAAKESKREEIAIKKRQELAAKTAKERAEKKRKQDIARGKKPKEEKVETPNDKDIKHTLSEVMNRLDVTVNAVHPPSYKDLRAMMKEVKVHTEYYNGRLTRTYDDFLREARAAVVRYKQSLVTPEIPKRSRPIIGLEEGKPITLYLGTKEANPKGLPTMVSPTSPTGNGWDLMPTEREARSLAESSLPADALKKGSFNEVGVVIPVTYTPKKILDMEGPLPPQTAATLKKYFDNTYSVTARIGPLNMLQGLHKSDKVTKILDRFDYAVRKAMPSDAPVESLNLRNVIDESLMLQGYDTKRSGRVVTPLKPISIESAGTPVGTGSRFEQAAGLQESASIYGDAATKADAAKARLEAANIAKQEMATQLHTQEVAIKQSIDAKVDAEWKLEQDLKELEAEAATVNMDMFSEEELTDLFDLESVDNVVENYSNWNCL